MRQRLFVPKPASSMPLAATDDVVSGRLAEELDYTRRLLENMGERLVGDPVILHKHGDTLQGFDLIGQLLGHLSAVLAAADRGAAIDRIGMMELRTRLRRTPLRSQPGPEHMRANRGAASLG